MLGGDHPRAREISPGKDTFFMGWPFASVPKFLELLMMWAREYPMAIIATELPSVHPETLSQWKT